MKIGIDVTGVWGVKEGLLNGIMSYVIHITHNLITIDSDNEYYIYCRDEIPPQLNGLSSSASLNILKSKNRKILQQVRLPVAAMYDRLDLMFFPYNSAALFCPCKSVVTIHDLHPYTVPERFIRVHDYHIHKKSLLVKINRMYWKNVLKMASKRSDRIIAVSKSTKKDIERYFHIPSEKINVVYEGVNREYFNINTDGKDLTHFRQEYNLPEKYILCVGTHAYKNIEGIITSASILKKKHHFSIKVVIAGNKSYLANDIFQLVKRFNLEDDIIFTGFFPMEDLKYLYQCAELFLFPSFYEGFGLPVLEAFACGVPVVTSTAGSLREVAGEAALLVNPEDPEDIASSAFKLLTDGDLRKKKRELGFKQIEKFSWDKAAVHTLAVFQSIR